MPPFQYDSRPSPFVGTIGDLIARQGQIQAAGVMGAGNAWAGAARDIGQEVGGTLQRVGERMADPAHQADQLKVEQLRRDHESQLMIEAAVTNKNNWKADGSGVDDAKVAAFLQKSGNGHAAVAWNTIAGANAKNRLDMQKTLGEINSSSATTAEKQQQLFDKQRAYVSELAFHTEQAIGAKGDSDPLHARDTFMSAVAHAAVDGGLSQETARSVLQRTAGASPAQLREVLGSLIDPTDRSKLEGQTAETKLKGAQATEAQARAAAIEKYGTTGTPPAAQAKSYRVKGVGDVPLEFVPGRSAQDPGGYFLNKPDGTRQQLYPGRDFVDVPAASVQVNTQNALTDDALDMAAKAYASSGQLPMGARDKDSQRRIMNRAAQLFPTLDPSLNKAEYEANRKSLDGLQKQRDAIGAFEQTAQKNIDIFLTTAGKVVDTGSPLANTLLRQASGKVLGSPDQAAYDAARQVAVNEIAKITSNPTLSGQLSDSARHEVDAFNPANATLKQTVAVMRVLKQDMQNRTSSLDDRIADIKSRIGAKASTSTTDASAAVEGATKPIPGHPGTEQTFRGGKWIRTK